MNPFQPTRHRHRVGKPLSSAVARLRGSPTPSHAMTPASPIVNRMYTHPDSLREALARAETTFAEVLDRAGRGLDPLFERRLDQHQRQLRALLGEDADVASDAIDAAKRVIGAADPGAPLLMLAMARETLASTVRRHLSMVREAA